MPALKLTTDVASAPLPTVEGTMGGFARDTEVAEAFLRFRDTVAVPVLQSPTLESARDRLSNRLDLVESFRRSVLEHMVRQSGSETGAMDLVVGMIQRFKRDMQLDTARRVSFSAGRQMNQACDNIAESSRYLKWLLSLPGRMVAQPTMEGLVAVHQLANRVEGTMTCALMGIDNLVPLASNDLLEGLCREAERLTAKHLRTVRSVLKTTGHESQLAPERLKAIQSVQRQIAPKLPAGLSLVDDLTSQRRVEAERELHGR